MKKTINQTIHAVILLAVIAACSNPSGGGGGGGDTQPNEHAWELYGSYPATCTSDGFELWQCTAAGHDGHTERRNENLASGHEWSPYGGGSAPTCVSPGSATQIKCDVCGEIEESSTGFPIDPNAHNWSSWFQTSAANCTQANVMTRTCTNGCGITPQTQSTISALGHSSPLSRTITKIPNYLEKGIAYDQCTRSGCDYQTGPHDLDRINQPACTNVNGFVNPSITPHGCFDATAEVVNRVSDRAGAQNPVGGQTNADAVMVEYYKTLWDEWNKRDAVGTAATAKDGTGVTTHPLLPVEQNTDNYKTFYSNVHDIAGLTTLMNSTYPGTGKPNNQKYPCFLPEDFDKAEAAAKLKYTELGGPALAPGYRLDGR